MLNEKKKAVNVLIFETNSLIFFSSSRALELIFNGFKDVQESHSPAEHVAQQKPWENSPEPE